jgi:hypothetical protein
MQRQSLEAQQSSFVLLALTPAHAADTVFHCVCVCELWLILTRGQLATNRFSYNEADKRSKEQMQKA